MGRLESMNCKLCGNKRIKIIYDGKIRNGGLGKYTEKNVPMYQCEECEIIWHENDILDIKKYYESSEYRDVLEGSSEAERFYELHDGESLNKFQYTGTTIFRNKVVADIGCGCGAFLDFLKGVATKIIAIEPSEIYRNIMKKKGFYTFPYADVAKNEFKEEVDVITSFDVIEHVEDPLKFLNDIRELLSNDGKAIIGTPTDAPIMRELLGVIYEQKLLFSTQHLWIFSEKNLRLLANRVGFSECKVKYFQRYGISNMIGWLQQGMPCGHIQYNFVSKTLDGVYRSESEKQGMADYIVIYLKK